MLIGAAAGSPFHCAAGRSTYPPVNPAKVPGQMRSGVDFTIASTANPPLVKFMVRVSSAIQAQEQLAPTREICPDASVYDEAGRKIEDVELAMLVEQERLAGRYRSG